MRRITFMAMSTIAVLVLLFSYRTSTTSHASNSAVVTAAPGAGTTGGSTQSSTSGGSSATGQSGSDTASSAASGTYTGSVVSTRWGDVQVSITVADGKVTAVSVPVYPSGNMRDQEINSYALPILQQEVIAAQSADIDTVSGATVTSDGYISSLQAALDAAHLS